MQTGIGSIEVEVPRGRDLGGDEGAEPFKFSSRIVPPDLRRRQSVDDILPWLHIKCVLSGDFSRTLQALVGHDAPGLSATTVGWHPQRWESEHRA